MELQIQCIYFRVWCIYCRVPAGRGLRGTALAPGRDETQAVNPLVRKLVDLRKALTKRVQTDKLQKK